MRKQNNILRLITLLTLLMFCGRSIGQTTDSTQINHFGHQIELDIAPGYIFQTKDFLRGDNDKGERIDKTMALHLKYAFRFPQNSYFGRLYPHAYQGIGISYNTFFDYSEIGNPVALYIFQGSQIAQLTSRLSLDYEWNFGASFGWRPYNSETNPKNSIIGSNVNAYINLGFFLNWKMNSQWRMTGGVAVTHYSNGNTRYPNSGLNTIGARIGIIHELNERNERLSTLGTADRKLSIRPHISYDFVLYGALRSKGIIEENYAVPGSFAVVGFNLNPMYNFNKYLKAGISIDGQFDESANIENHIAGHDENGNLRFYRPPFDERIGMGLSLRGEFVMPIFAINFGIGHDVLYKGDGFGGLYQILALKTNITHNLFLHVGYQLNKFRDPKNLMIGFGYRFHNKRH
jgi:hypothetical protein